MESNQSQLLPCGQCVWQLREAADIWQCYEELYSISCQTLRVIACQGVFSPRICDCKTPFCKKPWFQWRCKWVHIFFSFSVPLGYIVVVDLELSSSLITCSLIESNLRFTLQILLILIIPFVAYNVKVLLKSPLFLLFALSCSWCLVSMPVHNFWMWALDLCHFALGII